MSSRARLRELSRLPRDFAFRGATSMQAVWLARALVERWPPRRPPQTVVLRRRDGVSDADWQRLWLELEAAVAELGTLGVLVTLAGDDREICAWPTGETPQGTLFEVAA